MTSLAQLRHALGARWLGSTLRAAVLAALATAGVAQQPAGDRGDAAAPPSLGLDADLTVDVYGQRRRAGAASIELHRRGVTVARHAVEQAGRGVVRLPCNPHSRRTRVLIEHAPESPEFAAALQRLTTSAEPADPGVPPMPSPEPPRLVGRMTARLESVGRLDERSRVVTLHTGGLRQALGSGDVLCVHLANGAVLELEVTADVPPAAGASGRMHVCVHDERGAGGEDVLEQVDPSDRPGFPRTSGAARDAFVAAHAPRVTIVTTFDATRGDHPANFVRVVGKDVTDTDTNGIDVAPDDAFEVSFTTPVDPATLRNLRISNDVGEVVARVFACDADGRTFRVSSPLGLLMTPPMREAILAQRDRPPAERDASSTFTVGGGPNGVRSTSGAGLPATLAFRFVLDPAAPDNVVAWRPIRRAKQR